MYSTETKSHLTGLGKYGERAGSELTWRGWIKFPPVSRKRLLPTTASFIKRQAKSILTVCAEALILDCYLVKRTSLVKCSFKEREIMRIHVAEEHLQREIVFVSLEMGIGWGFVVSLQVSLRNRSDLTGSNRRARPKNTTFRLGLKIRYTFDMIKCLMFILWFCSRKLPWNT